jgi:N utilization substance protein A
MQLIVNDDRLSLAIGKKGQNVRLASQLTGWRIDIHSESKVREMETRALASLSSIEGITAEAADALFKQGWRAAREVARTSPDELVGLPGIADVPAAERVVAAANRTAEIEEKRRQQEQQQQQEAEAAQAEGVDAAGIGDASEPGKAKKPPAEGRA